MPDRGSVPFSTPGQTPTPPDARGVQVERTEPTGRVLWNEYGSLARIVTNDVYIPGEEVKLICMFQEEGYIRVYMKPPFAQAPLRPSYRVASNTFGEIVYYDIPLEEGGQDIWDILTATGLYRYT